MSCQSESTELGGLVDFLILRWRAEEADAREMDPSKVFLPRRQVLVHTDTSPILLPKLPFAAPRPFRSMEPGGFPRAALLYFAR